MTLHAVTDIGHQLLAATVMVGIPAILALAVTVAGWLLAHKRDDDQGA